MFRLPHIPTPRARGSQAAAAFGGSSRQDTVEGTSLVHTATFLLPSDYRLPEGSKNVVRQKLSKSNAVKLLDPANSWNCLSYLDIYWKLSTPPQLVIFILRQLTSYHC